MSKIVDLRSDTVTRPVPAMRTAIAEAEVGDDVFGDDPTVILLEKRIAELFATETALFVPSGTMGNQVALASLTQPGDEIILDRQCHIFNYEVAAAPALSGLQFNPLDGDGGVITTDDIVPHIRQRDIHAPVTRIIAIENTHNRAGGRVFPLDEMKRIRALADERDLVVHLDGARLANAVVASGIPFKEYAACADTVSMCFSKGLGAPVGSVVAGVNATIDKARRKRKQFGGGMRQAGILAAAALYALDHHIDRLADDHANAKRLGAAIDAIDGLDLVYPVETNIVIFRVDDGYDTVGNLLARLEANGVLAVPFGSDRVRMVAHLDVDAGDIARAADVLAGLGPAN
ncbi:MAG: aminotransferase class I/II-fold pyridoxal phosphate-dependent enzyme [Candidatus Latescibacterota bacterium]|nr:MAG: aminotransferase class I/II-fold pyridoxal phosphate-dependent enzyme [Candidatus Latescibacterota bacterium]